MKNNMTKLCPQCGLTLIERKGISKKNNKPYHCFSCPEKACGYVEWVKQGVKQQGWQKETDQGAEILNACRKLWEKIDGIEKEMRNFFKIFVDKQDEDKEK